MEDAPCYKFYYCYGAGHVCDDPSKESKAVLRNPWHVPRLTVKFHRKMHLCLLRHPSSISATENMLWYRAKNSMFLLMPNNLALLDSKFFNLLDICIGDVSNIWPRYRFLSANFSFHRQVHLLGSTQSKAVDRCLS